MSDRRQRRLRPPPSGKQEDHERAQTDAAEGGRLPNQGGSQVVSMLSDRGVPLGTQSKYTQIAWTGVVATRGLSSRLQNNDQITVEYCTALHCHVLLLLDWYLILCIFTLSMLTSGGIVC